MKQIALFSVGDRARTCLLCDGVITGARCHPCRNTYPRPGTASHARWMRGIVAVVRRRLEDAGLGALAADACRALIIADVPIPSVAVGLLADIAEMPISVVAYQRAEQWALDYHTGMLEAVREGITGDNVAIFARAFANATTERRGMPRLRIETPTMLRVASLPDDDEAEREDAAVEESAAEDQHPQRRIARTL